MISSEHNYLVLEHRRRVLLGVERCPTTADGSDYRSPPLGHIAEKVPSKGPTPTHRGSSNLIEGHTSSTNCSNISELVGISKVPLDSILETSDESDDAGNEDHFEVSGSSSHNRTSYHWRLTLWSHNAIFGDKGGPCRISCALDLPCALATYERDIPGSDCGTTRYCFELLNHINYACLQTDIQLRVELIHR